MTGNTMGPQACIVRADKGSNLSNTLHVWSTAFVTLKFHKLCLIQKQASDYIDQISDLSFNTV